MAPSRLKSSLLEAIARHRDWKSQTGQCLFNTRGGGSSVARSFKIASMIFRTFGRQSATLTVFTCSDPPKTIFPLGGGSVPASCPIARAQKRRGDDRIDLACPKPNKGQGHRFDPRRQCRFQYTKGPPIRKNGWRGYFLPSPYMRSKFLRQCPRRRDLEAFRHAPGGKPWSGISYRRRKPLP